MSCDSLNSSEPVWIPEIGLGIGRALGVYEEWEREWLFWYDEQGNRLPSPDERMQQKRQRVQQAEAKAEQTQQQLALERQRAEQERQRVERLAELLHQQGINPDNL